MRADIIRGIEADGYIAILRGYTDEQIKRIAEALLAGGIRHIEITYDPRGDWDKTARAIGMLTSTFGDALSVGAGTVLFAEQVAMTAQAGGQYIISPNADPAIIGATVAAGLVSIPGAFTPTECVAATQAGADFIKLFPISEVGASYLAAVSAPLAHIKFLAVGGVAPEDVAAYTKAGAVGFGIAGKLDLGAAVKTGDYTLVTAGARRYREALDALRA